MAFLDYYTDNELKQWALSMMEKGVIVKLSVCRWRAISQIVAGDLGLKLTKEAFGFMDKYINLGYEKLIPPEYDREISKLDALSKRCLDKYSFNTAWGRFVPYTAFTQWHNENKELKLLYLEAGKQLVDNYPELIKVISEEYQKLAMHVWEKLYPNQGKPTAPFVTEFVSKILNKIPPPEKIACSFQHESSYLPIPLPQFIRDNFLQQNDNLAETELEIESKKIIHNEYNLKQQYLINSFVKNTVNELRRKAITVCEPALTRLNSDQNTLSKPQRDNIRKLLKYISILNFYNDSKLITLLTEVKQEIECPKIKDNKDNLVNILTNIVNLDDEFFHPFKSIIT